MRKSKYETIGQTGTAEQFRQALGKATGSRFYSSGKSKLESLTKGAVAAFHESRPENIQAALQGPETIEFGSGLEKSYYPHFIATLFFMLSEKSADKRAVIELALAGTPEQAKKEILSQALLGAVRFSNLNEESFIAALLQAGADANAVCDGEAGRILACAVESGSMPVIKLLDQNGANLGDAFTYMQKHGWTSNIEKLRLYKETVRDNPAVAEADVWRQEMQGQVRELTEKVDRLSSLMEAFLEANQPAETTPVQSTRPSSLRIRNALT